MIINGSMNYTTSGRRRRSKNLIKKVKPVFQVLEKQRYNYRETPEYPSVPMNKYTPAEDTSYKQEVSKNYTVAIAYNKGAYQVIPKDSVKDIGK